MVVNFIIRQKELCDGGDVLWNEAETFEPHPSWKKTGDNTYLARTGGEEGDDWEVTVYKVEGNTKRTS